MTLVALLSICWKAWAGPIGGGGFVPGGGATTSGGGGSITGGACGSNKFTTAISASGIPTCVQPSASQITGLAASATTDATNAANISTGIIGSSRLPTITSSNTDSSLLKSANNLADVTSAPAARSNLSAAASASCGAHQYANALGSGSSSCAQPAASDVTGLAASATTDTTNASNILSGTLSRQRMAPAAAAAVNGYYSANGQPGATFGGAMFAGSAQVTQIAPPTGVACTCAGGTGTTYYYAVSSMEYPMNGTAGGYQPPAYVIQGPAGESVKSAFVSCGGPAVLSYPSGYCTVSWNQWSTVAGYKVWGRTSGATTSLTGVSQNTGTGGMTGSSFVDYGILTPLTSSVYQSGLFKAEGGIGTGDWSWNNWPGQPGDVYFKELGSSKVNVVLGTTTDQINNNSSNQMVLAGLNGVGLNSDTQFLKSRMAARRHGRGHGRTHIDQRNAGA